MKLKQQLKTLENNGVLLTTNLLISTSVAYFLNLYFGSFASFFILLLLVLATTFAYRKIGLRFRFYRYICVPVLIIVILILILASLCSYHMEFKEKFLISLPLATVILWNYTYKIVYRLKK